MITKRITVFRAGVFSTEPYPPWMEAVHAAEVEREDYDAALDHVLGQRTSHSAVNGVAWPAAEVITRRTPDGGYFVDMMAEATIIGTPRWVRLDHRTVEVSLRSSQRVPICQM